MKGIFFLLFMIIVLYQSYAQPLTNFSGTVTDNKSVPIQGATASLLNTNFISITDEKGIFIFRNVPAGNYILHVTGIAYASVSQEIAINAGSNNKTIQLSENGKRLDEVIVTAQKREEALQQVPFSISALSAKQVLDYRIWNLKDITAVVPNLYSANPGDNRNVTGIRGIATTSYDPAVATYIDGVNQFGLNTYIPQLFDAERIEVLRGPQGTLYGRNAMGGVINVITKQPTNKTSGFGEIDLGNYNLQRYSIGIRTPLIKDKLFFGAAGMFNAFGGFYTNLFNNTRMDKQHAFLGNYYLKYLASQSFNLTLNVKNYANRNNGPFTLAGKPADALSAPFKLNQNATTKMIDNIFNASLTARYTGSFFNMVSSTAYQQNYRYYTTPIDGDFSPLDAVTVINNYGKKFNKIQVATQELRFSSPAPTSKFRWTAGVYGFYRYSPGKTGTHFGADAAAVGSPITNFTSINTNTEHGYGLAGFGQLVYLIHPRIELTAGLRYDYEHKKEAVKGAFQRDGREPMVTKNDTASSAHFNALSPKFSAGFHLTENNNVYVTYSRGFRAGGISQIGADPSQPPLYAFQPEYSNNFELGSKNSFFTNRLRVNIALFYTTVSNAQVPTLILPQAITVTKNAGKLRSWGAEAEIAATLLKGLDLLYNFGYTHARYTDLQTGSNRTVRNLNGNHQVFTPDFTSMLVLQYNFPINASSKLVMRSEWRWLGNQYFDLANRIEQQAYSVLNARLGVSMAKFEIDVWGSNLGNKRYIDYAYDFGASHLGNPLTYGITLRTQF